MQRTSRGPPDGVVPLYSGNVRSANATPGHWLFVTVKQVSTAEVAFSEMITTPGLLGQLDAVEAQPVRRPWLSSTGVGNALFDICAHVAPLVGLERHATATPAPAAPIAL